MKIKTIAVEGNNGHLTGWGWGVFLSSCVLSAFFGYGVCKYKYECEVSRLHARAKECETKSKHDDKK